MIKVVLLVAVIAVVGSKAPAPFGTFNKAGGVRRERGSGGWVRSVVYTALSHATIDAAYSFQ